MNLYRNSINNLLLLCGLLLSIQSVNAAEISDSLKTQFQQVGVSTGHVVAFEQSLKRVQLSDAEVESYGQIIITAQQAHIPLNLLLERLNQGVLKNVPTARLQQALMSMQTTLVWSSELIASHVAKAEIRTQEAVLENTYRKLETALRSNISKQQIEQIVAKQQLTLAQLSAVMDLAMELQIANAPERALVLICQRSLQQGLTANEIDQISQKLPQLIPESFSEKDFLNGFEKTFQTEFDFELDFSDIVQDFSLDSISELNESIQENIGEQLNDIPVEGVEGVVEGLEINPEVLQPDMDF